MIILHNPHDKRSRNFVKLYGTNMQIIEYPECIKYYPRISAFPAVVIVIPEHHIPDEYEFNPNLPPHPLLDIEKMIELGSENVEVSEFQDSEIPIIKEEYLEHDLEYVTETGNVSEYITIYNNPESLEEIQLYLEEWEAYASAYPIKD